MGYRSASLLALAVAGLVSFMAAPAEALTVLNYTELGNQGTKVVTNNTPLSVITSSLTKPYGAAAPSITPSGGGVLLTFAPTATFASNAANAGSGGNLGGQQVDTDGKLDFLVTFDQAINLSAIINEGGAFSI